VLVHLAARRAAEVVGQVAVVDAARLGPRDRQQAERERASVGIGRSFRAVLGDQTDDFGDCVVEQERSQRRQVAGVEGCRERVEDSGGGGADRCGR